MSYVKKVPKEESFKQDGLNGYTCQLQNANFNIVFEDCYKGHEKYSTNLVSTHVYYILEGNGKFKIDGKIYEVVKGDIIEIPPKIEFVFAGKMKLLLMMTPKFDSLNDIKGKENDLY